MLPFLSKEETTIRQLESQIQRRDWQISNLESSLNKAQTENDKLKTEITQQRNALREAEDKAVEQEQLRKKYAKELKPAKERCIWLQEEVTRLKREIEEKASKEKDLCNKHHQKSEETDRLKNELLNARRELDIVKGSAQNNDMLSCRLRAEAQTEIDRLRSELTAKTRAVQLIEAAVNKKEFSEEQKMQLEKAACYDKLLESFNRSQNEVKELRSQMQSVEDKVEVDRKEVFDRCRGILREINGDGVHVKDSVSVPELLSFIQDHVEKLIEQRTRMFEHLDSARGLSRKLEELESEKTDISKNLDQFQRYLEKKNEELKEYKSRLEEKEIREDGYKTIKEKLKEEVERKEAELSGIRAACERLQEENERLYEHVAYSEEQLMLAKEAIAAKQGILENERALGDSEKKQSESMNRLIQGLRSELESSRRQIAELAAREQKATNAIQAFENRISQMKAEHEQLISKSRQLDKELKASQVEILRVQQELSATTEKMQHYKSQVSNLRQEATERDRQNKLPKDPEYYALKERVKMLEEQIIHEKNSHDVTKNMLKQESDRRGPNSNGTGSTHISTPFPHPGTNFRFSYCRDIRQSDRETPTLAFGSVPDQGSNSLGGVNTQQAAAHVQQQGGALALSPVPDASPNRMDDEAMDVDEAHPMPFVFSTPAPKRFPIHTGDPYQRRATLDFHQLSSEVFIDLQRSQQEKE